MYSYGVWVLKIKSTTHIIGVGNHTTNLVWWWYVSMSWYGFQYLGRTPTGNRNEIWWFSIYSWLVVWNINFVIPYIGLLLIPTDFHIFQRSWNHQPDSIFLHVHYRWWYPILIFGLSTINHPATRMYGNPDMELSYLVAHPTNCKWVMSHLQVGLVGFIHL